MGEGVEGLVGERVLAFGHLLEGYQRLIAHIEDDLKASAGMRISEMEVLVRLANEPDHELRPTELAQQCVMSPSGCTRLLDRLEQQQLVLRRPHAGDGRGFAVSLTPRGLRLLESVLPAHYESLEARLWSALSDRQVEQLSRIMRKVRDHNT